MPMFTIRVELRGSDWDTYNKLHEKMKEHGYVREITGDDGIIYQLPDAEYVGENSLNALQVRQQVFGIANALNIDPHVLVSETLRWSWQLPKASR